MESEFRFGRRVNFSDGFNGNDHRMRDEVQVAKITDARVNRGAVDS
jgi:hypothetical protein